MNFIEKSFPLNVFLNPGNIRIRLKKFEIKKKNP